MHDVTAWLTNNCNILRSKDNKAMKFGHLIEYNKRNIFLENHTQNALVKNQ